MSVQQTRDSGGNSFREWPSPQVSHNQAWRVKLRVDHPDLGDGFVVPHVYDPSKPMEVWRFTVDSESWQPIFDTWFVPGRDIMITGELFLDIREAKHEKGYNPAVESPFVGYRKPSRIKADVKEAYVRVDDILTPNMVDQNGRERFNMWTICILLGAGKDAADSEWRVRFPTRRMPEGGIVVGEYYKISYNRRIDVLEFYPPELSSDENAPMPF